MGSEVQGFAIGDMVVADPTGESPQMWVAEFSRMRLLSLLSTGSAIVLREHRSLGYLHRWSLCGVPEIVSSRRDLDSP